MQRSRLILTTLLPANWLNWGTGTATLLIVARAQTLNIGFSQLWARQLSIGLPVTVWAHIPSLRELRCRMHAELNKGEARNALTRAVFYNRPFEVRDRSFEQ
jgi:hypothetical protein